MSFYANIDPPEYEVDPSFEQDCEKVGIAITKALSNCVPSFEKEYFLNDLIIDLQNELAKIKAG